MRPLPSATYLVPCTKLLIFTTCKSTHRAEEPSALHFLEFHYFNFRVYHIMTCMKEKTARILFHTDDVSSFEFVLETRNPLIRSHRGADAASAIRLHMVFLFLFDFPFVSLALAQARHGVSGSYGHFHPFILDRILHSVLISLDSGRTLLVCSVYIIYLGLTLVKYYW